MTVPNLKKVEQIKEEYSEEIANEFINGSMVRCDGVEYFECQYSPYNVDDFELISDLSELSFFEENNEF